MARRDGPRPPRTPGRGSSRRRRPSSDASGRIVGLVTRHHASQIKRRTASGRSRAADSMLARNMDNFRRTNVFRQPVGETLFLGGRPVAGVRRATASLSSRRHNMAFPPYLCVRVRVCMCVRACTCMDARDHSITRLPPRTTPNQLSLESRRETPETSLAASDSAPTAMTVGAR